MLDCVIVGAGIAGLAAAVDLVDRHREVLVLEARDRVGGRIETATMDGGEQVDMGGQWIADAHETTLALVERLGLQTVGVTSGDVIVKLAGTTTQVPRRDELEASLNPFEISDLGQGVARFRRLAQRISRDPHWTQANATWLGQPLARWVRSNLRTPGAQAAFARVFEAAVTTGFTEQTLKDALEAARQGVDLESLVVVNGGVSQRRVVGGMGRVTDALAARLGDRLRLGAEVVRVENTGHHVQVTLADGSTVDAKRCVLALPPQLALELQYQPLLEPWRAELAAKVPPGTIIKAVAAYPSRWWGEQGFSGQMGADEGPVRVLFDVTDDSEGGRGLLTAFFGGSAAEWTPGLRQVALAQAVADSFGEGPDMVEYLERDWPGEPFTRGCHGAHFAPGIWTAAGPGLTAPHGGVYFAGAEYADRFNGYMEGALRSGEEAAAAVIRSLA